MGNPRKKLQALSELYESERDYIKDIHKWKELLDNILEMGKVRLKGSFYIIKTIAINVGKLEKTSLNLFNLLKEKNDRAIGIKIIEPEVDCLNLPNFPDKLLTMFESDVEYYTPFEHLLKHYKDYVKYIQNMPQIENEFEMLLDTDSHFLRIVNNYLQRENLIDLGIRNYLFRPSGKMVRYSNLIKAIIKHETDAARKKKYEELVERVEEISRELDFEFRKRTELFQTFNLSNRFVYGNIKTKFSFGLVYNKTKLLKQGKLIVKLSHLIPSSYKQVFIFNRLIIFCLTNDKSYGNLIIDSEPLFLSKLFILKEYKEFFRDEDLKNLYPLFLVQRENNKVQALYFEEESTRNVYFNIIDQAIQKISFEMCKGIKVKELKSFSNELQCLCLSENLTGSFLLSIYENEGTNLTFTRDPSSADLSHSTDHSISNSTNNSRNTNNSAGSRSSNGAEVSIRSNSNSQETRSDNDNSNITSTMTDQSNSSSNSINLLNFKDFGKEEHHENFIYSPSKETFEDIFTEKTVILTRNAFREEVDVVSQTAENNKGACFNICVNSAIPLNNTSFKNKIDTERFEYNCKLSFFSDATGLFSVFGSEAKKIINISPSKIYYDPEFEMLVTLCDGLIYIGAFHYLMDSFEPEILNVKASDFFFGKCSEIAYLAVVSNEDYSVSVIHLLSVKYEKEVVSVDVLRKLYVGFTIFNIFFLNGRIIISCRDFEIIEIDTLKTQELLEVYDSTLSLLLESKDYFYARSMVKLEKNSFLLCFNGGGYLINKSGLYKEENVNFDWEMSGEDFKVYKKYIIVLGKHYVSVFEIETGKMIFCKYMPGMKMVGGCRGPLIYNKKTLYELNFDEREGVSNLESEKCGWSTTTLDSMSIYNNLLNMSISSTKSVFSGWESTAIDSGELKFKNFGQASKNISSSRSNNISNLRSSDRSSDKLSSTRSSNGSNGKSSDISNLRSSEISNLRSNDKLSSIMKKPTNVSFAISRESNSNNFIKPSIKDSKVINSDSSSISRNRFNQTSESSNFNNKNHNISSESNDLYSQNEWKSFTYEDIGVLSNSNNLQNEKFGNLISFRKHKAQRMKIISRKKKNLWELKRINAIASESIQENDVIDLYDN